MVNTLHHPPKGAFSQSADNLIWKTDREMGKESGKEGKRRIRHVDRSRETKAKKVRRFNASAHPPFQVVDKWDAYKKIHLLFHSPR